MASVNVDINSSQVVSSFKDDAGEFAELIDDISRRVASLSGASLDELRDYVSMEGKSEALRAFAKLLNEAADEKEA